VFNSERSLPTLVERLGRVLPSVGAKHEVILVNDGSRDRSWQVITDLARDHPWVRGIDLLRNYGQHNALLCGIRAARNEIVVTIDDDLQNPPEEIPKLLEKMAEGYEVVFGTPATRQHGLWRWMASQATKLALQSAMGAEMARKVSSFRAFHAALREAFSDFRGPFVSIDVLLTWGTTSFASVEVGNEPRAFGRSNYTLGKLITHAMNMITGFSVAPLRLASLVGFAFTVFGLAVLAYVVGRFVIEGQSVPGFPFLASIVAIFSGAQLFALGIIGEYLSRMYSRTMDKPPYAIRNHIGPR
jgi:undecaprenyl-phosphate 4-deoxy-4-formamido-L-arabinose transferase